MCKKGFSALAHHYCVRYNNPLDGKIEVYQEKVSNAYLYISL